jgi:hypothetical protein
VGYADVRALMTSQFRQQMKAIEPADGQEGRNEIRDAVGIDIEQDIDYVVGCVLATPAGGTETQNGYILAHGRFDKGRIEAFVREKGGVAQDYRGRPTEAQPEGATTPPHPEMGVTFVNQDVVALGSTAALKKVIDIQFGETRTVLANSDVMTMIETVEPGNNAWVVGRFDVLSKQAHLPSEVAGQLPQVTWFSAGGHVNGGVNGTVSLQARDEEAAKNLAAVVGGFIALGNMQASTKPELQAIMKSIALSSDTGRNTVTLSFSLPSTAIDALKNAAIGMRRQPTPAPGTAVEAQPK